MTDIREEFPSNGFDSSPRVGQRFEDPQLEKSIAAFVRRNMAKYTLEKPDATDEELAAHEDGLREGIISVIEGNRQDASADAQEAEAREQERIKAAETLGEDALQEEVRVAELEAYAMKPYMDEIAEDIAANTTPVRYVGEDGRLVKKGGLELSTELKTKHYKLESAADFGAREAVRMDEAARDPARDPVERAIAQESLDSLTNPDRKITYDAQRDRIDSVTLAPTAETEPSSVPEPASPPEAFDEEEWLKQNDSIDPEINKNLYKALSTIQKKLAENWQAARNNELPKDTKDELRKVGLASLNITRIIIEDYFDATYLKGLEDHDKGLGDRKRVQELFNTLAGNSGFVEEVKLPSGESAWVKAKVDIYAQDGKEKAIQCLEHAYHEVSKDLNDPRAIGYGDIAMRILGALQNRLSIKVPESDKAKFQAIIDSLQVNERAVTQVK